MQKQLPILFSTPMVQAILNGSKTETRRIVADKFLTNGMPAFSARNAHLTGVSPYGQHGDILYVRETFTKSPDGEYAYKSTCDAESEDIRQEYLRVGAKWAKWKPGRYMPKEAARIWLKVNTVKVERLQDITDQSAKAEGIVQGGMKRGAIWYKDYTNDRNCFTSARASYSTLWESINGRESWKLNPWVWVVKFSVLSTVGKPENL